MQKVAALWATQELLGVGQQRNVIISESKIKKEHTGEYVNNQEEKDHSSQNKLQDHLEVHKH